MADHKPVKPQKAEVERAQNAWDSFVRASKLATYGTCLILVALWVFLIAI